VSVEVALRSAGKASVEGISEVSIEEVVRRDDVADALESQLLHESVLQRPVGALDAALGGCGVGAQDVDVQVLHGAPELRQARAAMVLEIHSEDARLVAVERDRPAMLLEVALHALEVSKGGLAFDEAHLHELARRVLDEHQQETARGARSSNQLWSLPSIWMSSPG